MTDETPLDLDRLEKPAAYTPVERMQATARDAVREAYEYGFQQGIGNDERTDEIAELHARDRLYQAAVEALRGMLREIPSRYSRSGNYFCAFCYADHMPNGKTGHKSTCPVPAAQAALKALGGDDAAE